MAGAEENSEFWLPSILNVPGDEAERKIEGQGKEKETICLMLTGRYNNTTNMPVGPDSKYRQRASKIWTCYQDDNFGPNNSD